jgi:DNA gyrase subunit A
MLMTKGGTIVRTRVDEIRTTGRAAQGVTIMNLDKDDVLTGVARCPSDGSDGDAESTDGTPDAPVPTV